MKATHILSKKEFGYVSLLNKWFESDILNISHLQFLLDNEIPFEINNYKLAVFMNTLGWWYDRIENSSSDSIKTTLEYQTYKKELKKYSMEVS